MTTFSPDVPRAGVTTPADHVTSEALQALITPRAVYRVGDAAAALGLSRHAVCYHMRQRPRVFPPREGLLARRHEWSAEEFVKVLWGLCCLSPQAERNARHRLSRLQK
jgi:hypothetical protein